MSHYIRSSGCCLVSRKSLGKCRIQNTELRSDGITAGASLEHTLFLCDNGIRAAFASCCGNGKYCSYRKSFFDSLSSVKIPEVAVIDGSGRYCFGGVYNAATTYRKYEVYSFFPAEIDSLIYEAVPGIGLYTAELDLRNSLIIERFLYSHQKS